MKKERNKCRQGWEVGTLVHCGWECKVVQPLWKRVWQLLEKWMLGLAHDPAASLLAVYRKGLKGGFQADICTHVYSSIVLEKLKGSSNPSPYDWIQGKADVVFTHTMENCLARRRQEVLTQATTWRNLEDIMLSEISQSQTEILEDSTYIRYLELSHL